MKTYLYGLLAVLISQQTAVATEQVTEIQAIENLPDEDNTTQVQLTEDLSPGSPYNINNSVREEGIKHDLKYDGCNGFIRGGYIQTHVKTISNEQAYGFGGELGCGISWGPFFKFHVSAFTAINPGFNSGNKDEIQGDFFDEKKTAISP